MAPQLDEKEPHDFSSSRPLLYQDGLEADDYDLERARRPRGRFTLWHVIPHLALLVVYTTVFFAGNQWYRVRECHRPLVYTPAQDAVQYQRLAFNGDLDKGNRYKGQPRPELDQTWHDLLEFSNIRISKEELKRLNRTSIQLNDGSGDYFGALNVHHHLHCLKYVRHYLWRDHYNDTGEFNEPNVEEHLDHCLDDVRQALMCKADLAVYTYDWIPNYRKPYPNFKIDHECVNWESLNDWARERSFSIFDQKSLVHPQLGLSFPLVDGEIESLALGDHTHFVHLVGHGHDHEQEIEHAH